MPLMYVPLIMYASWMDFMARTFVVVRGERDNHMKIQQSDDTRACA